MKHFKSPSKLDKLDIKILSALSRDGRMTKLQLSEEISLSATPCWERMKKLEKSGIIKGYHAAFDLRALTGVFYTRVEVTIRNHTIHRAEKFEKIIKSMPEVIECEAVLGSVDYILKILSQNIENYQQIIAQIHEEEDIELDYRSLPVSKVIKEPYQADILEIYETFAQK